MKALQKIDAKIPGIVKYPYLPHGHTFMLG
jgi:hypothetical protein